MILYPFNFKSMGCQCSMQIYAENEDEAKRIFALCFDEANRLDKYYTNYSATSFTAEINRSAGNRAGIIVDDETAYLLDYAQLCFTLASEPNTRAAMGQKAYTLVTDFSWEKTAQAYEDCLSARI